MRQPVIPSKRGRIKSLDDLRSEILTYIAGKRLKQARYSLRSFAKHAGLNPTSLSLFLAEKRRLSAASTQKLLTFLKVPQGDIDALLANPLSVGDPLRINPRTSRDWEATASTWRDFALLSLMETIDFRVDALWISKRLALTERQVRIALERLERLDLIVKESDGTFRLSGQSLQFGGYESEKYLREIRRNRFLSENKKIRDVITLGTNGMPSDMAVITMAVNPDKIPLVRERVAKFRRLLARQLEGGKKREVYFLAVQLLPITRQVE